MSVLSGYAFWTKNTCKNLNITDSDVMIPSDSDVLIQATLLMFWEQIAVVIMDLKQKVLILEMSKFQVLVQHLHYYNGVKSRYAT